ncbi:MAG: GGDEF domain-containing protein [Nitrospira sp.]|nr:GGDEF domain-containing protein [bacterium]MBL7049615.1 GGDEF domain-containing protein [Nitrospira sp.]
MSEEVKLSESDTEFEEKVFLVADEVLTILRELSQENQKQISSKSIAEKMVWKGTLKGLLRNKTAQASPETAKDSPSKELESLSNISDMVLNRFSELAPAALTDELSDLKDSIVKDSALHGSTEWLDSPINFVKRYIESLVRKNSDLEDFMQQAMSYLAETESHVAGEMNSHKEKFENDNAFADSLTANMNELGQNISVAPELGDIKSALLGKIQNINRKVETKKEEDLTRLKDTEDILIQMGRKMSEIKREADEIRKKSQAIEFESIRDTLTGLFNRRAYDDRITETLANLERYDVQASIMICDIDFFKKINDTHGHKVGDIALKKMASLLKDRLRTNDFIARFGGEEFAIVLPHTGLEGARVAGEGIRAFIDKSKFSYMGEEIPLTISVGVSEFKKGDDDTSAFERADKALYLAKQSGRNLVKTDQDLP